MAVTGPDRDRLLVALAEAIEEVWPDVNPDEALRMGGDLLRFVESYGREQAATALRDAAAAWRAYDTGPAPKDTPHFLRNRAAALHPEGDRP